jgi:hypothetical protein
MGELLMNKQLVAALAASVVISGVGTAFAADDFNHEIKFDGSFSTQYRAQREYNQDLTKTALKTTLTLNVDAPLAKNLDAYASFNYQNIRTNDEIHFISDYFNTDDKNNTGLSAVGLKYKNDGYSYVIGSQALTLGGGLAYDNGYIGRHALPYALNISKKVGATDLTVIAAKTNYQGDNENDKFYVVQGSYAINPKSTVGAMYAHVSYGSNTIVAMNNVLDSSVNFYSIYGSHKLTDKATLSGEYINASSSINNQGFQTNLSYKLDEKNTLGAGYYRVEDQASIYDLNGGGMTTSPNNNTEGYIVSWKHDFDKNFSLKVADLNYKAITGTDITKGGAGGDRNRFYTTATVSF